MPAVEVAGLVQVAVLWRLWSLDSRGQKRVREPEEIKVRWQDRSGVGVGSVVDGGTDTIDATVVVGEDVPLGSILWLGRLEEWNPGEAQELMEAVGKVVTPDLKGRNIRRTITLRRYRDSLPEVVPQQVAGSGSGG